MNTLTSEWGKKFKLGSRVTARILWVVPEEKRVALALVPHLISLTPFAPPSSLAVGSSHNCAVGLTVGLCPPVLTAKSHSIPCQSTL